MASPPYVDLWTKFCYMFLCEQEQHYFFLHFSCRSRGLRIDTGDQDAHEMLHVLLTLLEVEMQKSSENFASKTASLAFYDDKI